MGERYFEVCTTEMPQPVLERVKRSIVRATLEFFKKVLGSIHLRSRRIRPLNFTINCSPMLGLISVVGDSIPISIYMRARSACM